MTANDVITIHAWKEEQVRLLSDFYDFWLTERATNFDNFPLALPPGEWDEQWAFYKEQHRNDRK